MKILVTPKINPDLDGLSCAYAYAKLLITRGKEVTEGIFGKPHVEARYLIDRFEITDLHFGKDLSEDFDKFIIVDASSLKGLPQVVRAKGVIEVIDHRFININNATRFFPNAKIQIEPIGAAATLIVERYIQAKIKPKRNVALLLYGAIFSNTLNLKAKVTHSRDIVAIKWLKGQNYIPKGLIEDMFQAKTEAIQNQLTEVLIGDFKDYQFSGKKIGIAQLEALNTVNIIKNQKDKINKTLLDLKSKHSLDYIFLTAVDVKEGVNYFFVLDEKTKNLLKQILDVRFENEIGRYQGVILRKEISPKLRDKQGIIKPTSDVG